MEYWSTGVLEYCVLSIIPLLHHSNIPVFQAATNALFTISCASLTIVFKCDSSLKLSA